MVNCNDTQESLSVSVNPEGIEITTLPSKSYAANLFLVLWLVGWMYGEFVIFGKVLDNSDRTPDAISVFWLFGWTLGGIFAGIMWLWNNKGHEIIRIDDKEIRLIKVYVIFTRSKIYDVYRVRNLRVNRLIPSMDTMSEGMEFWGLSGGAIAFDYELDTPKFGLSLDEEEAEKVLQTIFSQFKFLS
jgi:hypothetical protein